MSYVDEVYERVVRENPSQPEFHQAVREVLDSLRAVIERNEEKYRKEALLERLTMPERQILFRVPWVDDKGQVQVNNAASACSLTAPSARTRAACACIRRVNLGIIKFLGFEQTFKNSLTGLPIGGGKGGSDFDPKGKIRPRGDGFLPELHDRAVSDTSARMSTFRRAISARARAKSAICYGQYKRLTGRYEGVLTGKGLSYGGSLARTEATGYGLLYLTQAMLTANGHDIAGKTVAVSGAGNVAIYAVREGRAAGRKGCHRVRFQRAGFTIRKASTWRCSRMIKEVRRARLTEYRRRPQERGVSRGHAACCTVKCDVALPCATQNELRLEDAKALVENGCIAVAEGANMPTTLEATDYLREHGVLFAPGKAANAGGVATSALEMSQNSMRLSWSFDEVDAKLKDIMVNIFNNIDSAAKEYGMPGNYVAGANIAGFLKVANAMEAQGVV